MTEKQFEKNADEAWIYWRRKMREDGVDVSKFSEVDIWHHAFVFGVSLGINMNAAGVAFPGEIERLNP